MVGFDAKLLDLVSSDMISKTEYAHYLTRGIQFEKFTDHFPNLQNLFPNGIPIGASSDYIEKLDIPYQETSYVCAPTKATFPHTYLFKTNASHGGVTFLLGGKRPPGDNLFGSLNRILLGNKAVMISADNLIENSQQIWNWDFFGRHLRKNHPRTYHELKNFSKIKLKQKPIHVIMARKKSTFERLGFLKAYLENKIKIFNSPNDIVFLTNNEGFEYASKTITPDEHVHYVHETNKSDRIDIRKSLQTLRKKFNIKLMLNDGGRQMTLGLKKLGVLGGERISYEPFPGRRFIPKKINEQMILGKDGIGIDNSPISDSFSVYSHEVNIQNKESFKLHLYPMLDV